MDGEREAKGESAIVKVIEANGQTAGSEEDLEQPQILSGYIDIQEIIFKFGDKGSSIMKVTSDTQSLRASSLGKAGPEYC